MPKHRTGVIPILGHGPYEACFWEADLKQWWARLEGNKPCLLDGHPWEGVEPDVESGVWD